MTVQESADALREPRTVVLVADYDEYLDAAYCPICGTDVTSEVGTPEVPARFFEAAIDEDLPAFGWRCDCRRFDLVLVATADAAPASFAPVEITVDGETTTIAIPEPVHEAALPETR